MVYLRLHFESTSVAWFELNVKYLYEHIDTITYCPYPRLAIQC